MIYRVTVSYMGEGDGWCDFEEEHQALMYARACGRMGGVAQTERISERYGIWHFEPVFCEEFEGEN